MKRAMNAFSDYLDKLGELGEVHRDLQADIEAYVGAWRRRLLGRLSIFRSHLLWRDDGGIEIDEEYYWVAATVGKEFHTGLPRFLEWEVQG